VNPKENPTERGSGFDGLTTNRVQALADGVFAIVVTLMVFQIRVPELAAGQEAALGARLRSLWPELTTYLLTFAVSGVFWVGHHALFHHIRYSTRVLLWLNLAYLMFVAFIPFSAALLGRYPHQQIAVIWYGVHMILIGLCVYAQFLYAISNHRLVDPDLDPRLARLASQRILLSPAACVIAIAFSFVNVEWSVTIYWLIVVFYIFFPARLDRHLHHHGTARAKS
jgi:uncharacterized membrane protein